MREQPRSELTGSRTVRNLLSNLTVHALEWSGGLEVLQAHVYAEHTRTVDGCVRICCLLILKVIAGVVRMETTESSPWRSMLSLIFLE